MKNQNTLSNRATISFPAGLYKKLKSIARREKISLAWIVRAAAENYVAKKEQKGQKGN